MATTAALEREIREAINRCSAENGSDTPDFILARYLLDCLDAYDRAVRDREVWGSVPATPSPSPRGDR
jgi:hypothetical protein